MAEQPGSPQVGMNNDAANGSRELGLRDQRMDFDAHRQLASDQNHPGGAADHISVGDPDVYPRNTSMGEVAADRLEEARRQAGETPQITRPDSVFELGAGLEGLKSPYRVDQETGRVTGGLLGESKTLDPLFAGRTHKLAMGAQYPVGSVGELQDDTRFMRPLRLADFYGITDKKRNVVGHTIRLTSDLEPIAPQESLDRKVAREEIIAAAPHELNLKTTIGYVDDLAVDAADDQPRRELRTSVGQDLPITLPKGAIDSISFTRLDEQHAPFKVTDSRGKTSEMLPEQLTAALKAGEHLHITGIALGGDAEEGGLLIDFGKLGNPDSPDNSHQLSDTYMRISSEANEGLQQPTLRLRYEKNLISKDGSDIPEEFLVVEVVSGVTTDDYTHKDRNDGLVLQHNEAYTLSTYVQILEKGVPIPLGPVSEQETPMAEPVPTWAETKVTEAIAATSSKVTEVVGATSQSLTEAGRVARLMPGVLAEFAKNVAKTAAIGGLIFAAATANYTTTESMPNVRPDGSVSQPLTPAQVEQIDARDTKIGDVDAPREAAFETDDGIDKIAPKASVGDQDAELRQASFEVDQQYAEQFAASPEAGLPERAEDTELGANFVEDKVGSDTEYRRMVIGLFERHEDLFVKHGSDITSIEIIGKSSAEDRGTASDPAGLETGSDENKQLAQLRADKVKEEFIKLMNERGYNMDNVSVVARAEEDKLEPEELSQVSGFAESLAGGDVRKLIQDYNDKILISPEDMSSIMTQLGVSPLDQAKGPSIDFADPKLQQALKVVADKSYGGDVVQATTRLKAQLRLDTLLDAERSTIVRAQYISRKSGEAGVRIFPLPIGLVKDLIK